MHWFGVLAQAGEAAAESSPTTVAIVTAAATSIITAFITSVINGRNEAKRIERASQNEACKDDRKLDQEMFDRVVARLDVVEAEKDECRRENAEMQRRVGSLESTVEHQAREIEQLKRRRSPPASQN